MSNQTVTDGIVAGQRAWWLFALLVTGCAILPIFVTAGLNGGGPLRALWQWATFQAGDDSWYPIGAAMAYVSEHDSGTGLYQATYFQANHQFIYSPLSVVLFLGLRAIGLDFGTAATANTLSWFVLPAMAVAMFALAWKLAPPSAGTWRRDPTGLALRGFVAAALVFFFYPLLKGYTVGQIQTWLTALLMAALLAWLGGRRVVAGVCVGLFVVVKPHMGIILLWALARREFRVVAGFAAVLAVLGLASIAAFGWAVHAEYLDLLSYLSTRGESYRGSHTFESTVHRLLQNGNNLEWDGTHTQVRFIPWVHTASTVFGLTLLGTALVSGRPRGERESLIDFGIILISIILASPVAYEHHYGILSVLILIIFLHALPQPGRLGLVIAGGAALFLAANSLAFLDWTAPTRFNFVQSYRFWAALIALAALHVIKRSLRRTLDLPSQADGDAPRTTAASRAMVT